MAPVHWAFPQVTDHQMNNWQQLLEYSRKSHGPCALGFSSGYRPPNEQLAATPRI